MRIVQNYIGRIIKVNERKEMKITRILRCSSICLYKNLRFINYYNYFFFYWAYCKSVFLIVFMHVDVPIILKLHKPIINYYLI